VVITILVIAALSVIVVTGAGDYWESPWDDSDDDSDDNNNTSSDSLTGSWGSEIKIEFDDGTSESLKQMIDDNTGLFSWMPLSVKYENKDVTSFTYTLNGKATGKGYTETIIDTTNFDISFDLRSPYTNSLVNSVGSVGTQKVTIDLDDQWHEIFSVTKKADTVVPDTLSEKTYIVELNPSGTLSYDDGTGTFVNADLPDLVRFTIQKTVDDYIKIEFKSGYST